MNRVFKIIIAQNAQTFPKEYDCEFIGPGLVNYADIDCGFCRLDKETIDNMLPSFVGKPLTVLHQTVTPENFEKMAHGYVTNTYFDPGSGKYRAKFIATTDEAHKKIRDGWKVSCAYKVDQQTLGPGGTLHAIPYQQEIRNGNFTHLALVPAGKARYEDSTIVALNSVDSGFRVFENSKGEARLLFNKPKQEEKPMLKFKFHFPVTIEKVENSVDPATTFVEISGKKVAVKDLVDAFNSRQADPKENTAEVDEESVIEIQNSTGEVIKVSVKSLVEAYNAADSDEKSKKDAEDKEQKDMENAMSDDEKAEYSKMDDEKKCSYRKNMKERKNAEEKTAKEEKERQNAIEAEKAEKIRAEGKKNLKVFTFINSQGREAVTETVVGTTTDGSMKSGVDRARSYFNSGKKSSAK